MGFFDEDLQRRNRRCRPAPVEFIADGFQATETLFTEQPTEALVSF